MKLGWRFTDLKPEVKQRPMFLDKCRYALLNETGKIQTVRSIFLLETRGELKCTFKGEVSFSIQSSSV